MTLNYPPVDFDFLVRSVVLLPAQLPRLVDSNSCAFCGPVPGTSSYRLQLLCVLWSCSRHIVLSTLTFLCVLWSRSRHNLLFLCVLWSCSRHNFLVLSTPILVRSVVLFPAHRLVDFDFLVRLWSCSRHNFFLCDCGSAPGTTSSCATVVLLPAQLPRLVDSNSCAFCGPVPGTTFSSCRL
jgi:hypothetical protein